MMRNPFEWLATVITTRPLTVAGVAVICFLVALFGVTLVTMETGTDTYIDENTPRGALLSHYTDTYGSTALMLIFDTNDIKDLEILTYIDTLQADISNEQSVERVSGIVDLLKQGNGGMLPGSTTEVEQIISRAPSDVVERYIPSKMMTISVISLNPGLSESRQEQVLTSIQDLVGLSDPPPEYRSPYPASPHFPRRCKRRWVHQWESSSWLR